MLLDHGVSVALGVLEAWDARNTRFYVKFRNPPYIVVAANHLLDLRLPG